MYIVFVFSSKQGCHIQRQYSVQIWQCIINYYARQRVYIKHNLATLSIKLHFVQLLDVALLFMSVFINMYCICVAEVDTIKLMPLPALFPSFYYFLFLRSSVCQVRLAVLPVAFPCIIHKTKSKDLKKTFGLFFTVVSLLYNKNVRIFLEV